MNKIFKRMLLWIGGGLLLLLLLVFFIGSRLSAPGYNGKVSAHFNGEKFLNPGGVAAKDLGDVLKWYLSRDRGRWQQLKPSGYGEPPPSRVEGSLRVTFVNHATFLIQMAGLNILTDPIWSKRCSPFSWIGPKRMRPPGIAFEDLPPIDVVLISHNHYDHLDIPTLKKLYEAYKPAFYTPLGVARFLEQQGIKGATAMDWWDELPLSGQVTLVNVPAQHFSGRGLTDRDATLWSGYVVKGNNKNVYFAGDTGYNPRTFREIGERCAPISLSLLPIGAYRPQWFMSPIHVSPAQAVRIHQDTGSQMSIGMHFGTFPLADDGMKEPVRDLENALEIAGLTTHDFKILKEGQAWEIGSSR